MIRWAYGVTTIPGRRRTLLPQTLASLRAAGFDRPRLFVDGEKNPEGWEREFGLEVTTRFPVIRTYGNWILALAELYIREPTASHYAIFQDDLLTYKNLRGYIDRTMRKLPEKSYLNLYTFPANQKLCPRDLTVRREEIVGWYESNQCGLGGLGLVFRKHTVIELFCSRHMIERPLDPHRGWKALDGGVVWALQKEGYKEYVHNPSLVQHTGTYSSMGNRPHPKATSFRGADFDALELLPRQEPQ